MGYKSNNLGDWNHSWDWENWLENDLPGICITARQISGDPLYAETLSAARDVLDADSVVETSGTGGFQYVFPDAPSPKGENRYY